MQVKKIIIYWKFELKQWSVDEVIKYSNWHTVKEKVKQYMLVVESAPSMWKKKLNNICWEKKIMADLDDMTFDEEEDEVVEVDARGK